MRKLALLLSIVSTSVFAEWTEIPNHKTLSYFGKEDDSTAYVDIQSIKKKGNKVKIWSLFNYTLGNKEPFIRSLGVLSTLALEEYDCEEVRVGLLDWYWYSGNMKSGDVVYSSTHKKTEGASILPDSINESLFKIACGNK